MPSVPHATVWSTIELGTAILCACLPTYRKLLPSKFTIPQSIKSWYDSLLGTISSERLKKSASSKEPSDYNRFGDGEEADLVNKTYLTEAVGGDKTGTLYHQDGAFPLNAIAVDRRYDVE